MPIAIPKKILIVDDDAGILEAVRIILENEGYDVFSASSGDYFKEEFKTAARPDLILLDMLLSGMDGREICQNLKQNPESADIPIVMFSAHPNAEATVKKAGADAFLSKPFNISDLKKTIASLIGDDTAETVVAGEGKEKGRTGKARK